MVSVIIDTTLDSIIRFITMSFSVLGNGSTVKLFLLKRKREILLPTYRTPVASLKNLVIASDFPL